MGFYKIRVSSGTLAASNAASGLPTASTNGTAVPDGCVAEAAHLIVTKQNVATFDVYGYVTQIATWHKADTVSFTGTMNEVKRLDGITAFGRIYARRTDGNVSNSGLNTFWGFTEGSGFSA